VNSGQGNVPKQHRLLTALAVSLGLLVAGCSNTGDPSPPSSSTVDTGSPAEPTGPATTVSPTPGMSGELAEEVDRLIALTEELRELEFLSPPVVTVVTRQELAERVRADLAEDLEDIATSEKVYRLLGLVGPELDLAEIYQDLYGEQVAGFYDGDAGELVVPADTATFSLLQQSTMVHELTHALTDQHFGMWDSYQALVDAERFDEATALLAMIEGDAVLTEALFYETLDQGEQSDLLDDSLDVDRDVLDRAPLFVRDGLVFPYEAGFRFILGLFVEGGHDAVDAVYDQPPLSTESVFDLSLESPISIEETVVATAGYEVDSNGSWGALSWKLMFDQIIGGDPTAVDGWGGDRAIVYTDGLNVMMTLEFEGDTAADAEEMLEALDRYFSAVSGEEAVISDGVWRFDDPGYVAFTANGDTGVVLVVADDPSVGAEALTALAG
jgi:hypothetical protein